VQDSAHILNSSQTAITPHQAAVLRSAFPLYTALAALFIIAIAYHVRALEQAFPQWFGADVVQWPFLLDAEDQPYFVAQYLYKNARDAGLRSGDLLVAINGRPLTSRSVYSDILLTSHPGDH
jgi:PDZ domain-containing protein